MNKDMMKLMAHIDQSRSEMRDIMKGMSVEEKTELIQQCASGQLSDLDDRVQLMVGVLALITVFEFSEH